MAAKAILSTTEKICHWTEPCPGLYAFHFHHFSRIHSSSHLLTSFLPFHRSAPPQITDVQLEKTLVLVSDVVSPAVLLPPASRCVRSNAS